MNKAYQTWIITGALLLAPVMSRAETAAPPPAETKEAREQRIQWWREARFGMFIHWGLYAIPGGAWKDKVNKEGYSEIRSTAIEASTDTPELIRIERN